LSVVVTGLPRERERERGERNSEGERESNVVHPIAKVRVWRNEPGTRFTFLVAPMESWTESVVAPMESWTESVVAPMESWTESVGLASVKTGRSFVLETQFQIIMNSYLIRGVIRIQVGLASD
jgi:hypothetical protein